MTKVRMDLTSLSIHIVLYKVYLNFLSPIRNIMFYFHSHKLEIFQEHDILMISLINYQPILLGVFAFSFLELE